MLAHLISMLTNLSVSVGEKNCHWFLLVVGMSMEFSYGCNVGRELFP